MSPSEELARIGAFLAGIEDRAARRIEPLLCGRALWDDRVPNIWFANHVRLDPAADISAGELDAEAERAHRAAGVQHRRITVYDPAAGGGLAPGLRALGWEVDRLVVMVHRHAPEGHISTRSVRELKDGSWKEFRRQTARAEGDMTEDTIAQMEQAIEGLIGRVGLRIFGVSVDGMVASCCDLFSDGRTAQVEAVATLDAYRNRGLARAVVWRAVQVARRAGNDLVFLLAGADDWPRTLYRRLGFREVGFFFEFLKAPPEVSERDPGDG